MADSHGGGRPGRDAHASHGAGSSRVVTSLQNDTVKLIRSLDMRKARRETGLFLAEGASILITARDHGWRPRYLVTGPAGHGNAAVDGLVKWGIGEGAEHLDVSAAVLEKLAAKDNPQSVMAVFEQRWSELPLAGAADRASVGDAAGGRAHERLPALWVVLEEIRDPGNLGTILRTADAAGASGLVLVGQTCDPFSREAVRASMGSVFAVPIARADSDAFIRLAQAWRGDVVGTHLDGTEDFRAGNYSAPVLLVMGNEGAGLSAEAAAVCRRLVRIPMAGSLDSLNLAVATALMLYEVRRPDLKIDGRQDR